MVHLLFVGWKTGDRAASNGHAKPIVAPFKVAQKTGNLRVRGQRAPGPIGTLVVSGQIMAFSVIVRLVADNRTVDGYVHSMKNGHDRHQRHNIGQNTVF
jgi:hypothetical protein